MQEPSGILRDNNEFSVTAFFTLVIMKRTRISSRKRISANAVELGRLAVCLAESGSRLEDAFLEKQLRALILQLLEDGAEDDLNAALDRLFDSHAAAHDCLADMIEDCAESVTLTHEGKTVDLMLFCVPILAWSRFSIPSGAIPRSTQQMLEVQLGAHVFSAHTQIALADYLFSPDQLPHTFVDTWQLMHTLSQAALKRLPVHFDASSLPETNPFLSDTRYLIGAIAIAHGEPLFHWNEDLRATRESALKEWTRQGGPCLEPLLTGCAFQPLLADAYHAACRAADMASRPYSLHASIAFLQTMLGKSPESLRVVVGAFYDKRLEEYRISFGPRDGEAIFHGVIWPLLGNEDENTDVVTEVENLLREAGIKEIIVHEQQFPFEFCDDCGAPLYPNVEGESVHAELPEQNNPSSQTLH